MKKALNDFLNKFLLEISIVAVGAFATFVITTKVTAATQEQRINNLESGIEILRSENKADHNKIEKYLIDLMQRKP